MSPGRRTTCGVSGEIRVPTGHVFCVERSRGPSWYAKYRLPDGRQIQKKLGPTWTERGRPPAGYLTKRLAEDWLRCTLDEARRGTLPGMVRTGATFADAAAEYLRYIGEHRFARITGTAPIKASSGTKTPHRFDPGGNRQLNPSCTASRSSRSASTPQPAPTTNASSPKARPAKKPSAASNASSPTPSGNSSSTATPTSAHATSPQQ
jgi:hypothetical protein